MTRLARMPRSLAIVAVMLVCAQAGCGGSGGGASSLPDGLVSGGQSTANTATLNWQPPQQNSDGSALTDLQGYNIRYGTSSGAYSQTIHLDNPGLATYVVQNLAAGTYYFVISAYNSAGMESSPSAEVSAMVN